MIKQIYENRGQATISLRGVYRYSQDTRESDPVFSRIIKFAKIGVRIQFCSAGHIDIHKKLMNSTSFVSDQKYENQDHDSIS